METVREFLEAKLLSAGFEVRKMVQVSGEHIVEHDLVNKHVRQKHSFLQ